MRRVLSFRRLGLVIIGCLLFFPASLWADVRYVDIENGTDDVGHGNSPGTGAWKTLHYAVEQINNGNGDVLNVAVGTYSHPTEDDANLEITQSNVTIQGAADWTSIVAGPGETGIENWKNGIVINAADVTIRGLAVRNFGDLGQAGIRIESGTGNVIEGCETYDNYYGICVRDTSPEIRKNRIYDNDTGIDVYAQTGTASPTISNNLIYVKDGDMITGISADEVDPGLSAPKIYFNTIDGGIGDGVDSNAEETVVKYNIITNFNGYGIAGPVGNIAYNNVWNNTLGNYGAPSSAGTGDISENPLYASYELQLTSPCIDAIPLAVSDPTGDDIDGNPRPQGEAYDMGAYEQAVSTAEVVPVPPGEEIPEYIMVSFTVEPEDPSCLTVFGDEMGGPYDPENYRIGGYDPTLGEGGYRECDRGLVIEPGRAYWMLARNGLEATVDGTPGSLNDTEVPLLYSAATGNGWNQIGCPNAANYMWETVEVLEGGVSRGTIADASTDGLIDKRLWCWEAGTYHDDAILMEQGQGYWVRAMRANISLMFRQDTQAALRSGQDIMFARLVRKGKRWVKGWLFGPPAAIADSGDTPPMPMGAISAPAAEEESGGGGGGCFIDATARRFCPAKQ